MPWFAWIAIAGIIMFGVTEVVSMISKSKSRKSDNAELRALVESTTAVNSELLERLKSVDSRLGVVEKTLTDIP